MTKITFISWCPYHRRTELLAQHLNATLHFIHYGRSGKLLQAPIRYLIQGAKTWRILLRERPTIVLVQNPPIFCALLAALYALIYGGQYVIDSHTGAFVQGRWRWWLWLHRILSQRALTTIVHNNSQEKIVKQWGCRYFLLAFTPGDYSLGNQFSLDGRFNVAVISSFTNEEPTDVMFEAASHLPNVEFYFTGNPRSLPQQVLAQKPNNCHLMGYLPYDQYTGLLQAADAIMTLTNRDHTLLMGGFETVSIGKPLITSDWPVLKDYFSLGTVYVPNTAQGVSRGICQAQAKRDTLQRDILKLRDMLENEWKQKLEELQDILGIRGTTS